MSDYEILKETQAHADTCDIPVLATAANAMRKDIERGLAASLLAYLAKPLDLDRLYAEIDRVL